jgi:group I intron endonuclease
MNGHIYLIRNLVNGKGYIGQTIQTISARWNMHKFDAKSGQGHALHSAIRKYGVENFSVTEVVFCDALLLNDLEVHYINFYGTFASTGHGYNLLGGGTESFVLSDETRKKMSLAAKRHSPPSRKGCKLTQEHKDKIGLASRRTKHTPEWNAKVAVANRGKKLSEETKAFLRKNNKGMLGRKHTEETKAKMSIAKKGKMFTGEHRDNLSASHKGNHPSDDTANKMKKAQHERRKREAEYAKH